MSIDLPPFNMGIGLHPMKPILFCLATGNRLLVIDTMSKRITKEVTLDNAVSSPLLVEKNPAVSPDGRLLAIGNAKSSPNDRLGLGAAVLQLIRVKRYR